MSKNKKIIIIISVVLVILLGGGIIGYTMMQEESTSTIEKVSATAEKDITDIDWSTYDVYDITLDSGTVNITKKGVYNITGTLKGSIVINTKENVKLILNGVTITSNNTPAIYVKNSKNTYIELKDTNKITTKNTTDALDAAIYSKSDLFIYGDGTLEVNSNKDGIKSSDDLTIYSGTYKINAEKNGIKGRDSLTIVDGTFEITATNDGIKTTNEKKGSLKIEKGTFTINAGGDGISSIADLEITDGTFTIKTTGDRNTVSAKGIKASTNITINGAKFTINSTDDGIHSNKDVTVNGGDIKITSDDDGIHADGKLEINGGTLDITGSEGLEATNVKINDGTINIEASDDGINAANKSNDYEVSVEINGGNITIKMGSGDTDGIDSNGNLYIKGGTVNITGQSAFDYDGNAEYTGGKLIVNGEETTTITNQFMGGGGMPGGMDRGNMRGGMNGRR